MAQQQTTGTVVVACKLPMGMILRTFEMREVTQLTQAGTAMKVPMAYAKERKYFVNGPSHAQNKAPKSELRDSFALTPGVPADLWNEWLEQNKDSDLVRNGLIFAAGDDRSIKANATDNDKQKSGLERLDPKAMPEGLAPADKPQKH